jgi:hypothetical protein
MEITAEKLVRRLGYQAMVPYEEKLVRCGRSRHPRPWKCALYPGYLFASGPEWSRLWDHVNGKLPEREVDNIAAIYSYLHPVWTPMPYFLPAADVEYLVSIADGRYQPNPEEPPKKLQVGDRVILPDGPMQGYEGTATEISGENVTVDIKREKNTIKIKTKLAKLEKV